MKTYATGYRSVKENSYMPGADGKASGTRREVCTQIAGFQAFKDPCSGFSYTFVMFKHTLSSDNESV
jgi:hypothetical protein